MNIRSITLFADIATFDDPIIETLGKVVKAAQSACEETGLHVQTTRLATQPLAEIDQAIIESASKFEESIQKAGFDYAVLGLVRLDDPIELINILGDVFESTSSLFGSVEIATIESGLDPIRIRKMSALIKRLSQIDDDGLTNLMVTASANVGPWAPFFPAAYHGGGKPRIAIATESADLAVEAISFATTLADARQNLISEIETTASKIESILQSIADEYDIVFEGIDFTLAPYPEEARSIGTALEALGVSTFGSMGSLAASAWLTDTLDQARFKRTGFCGLMLPVLEDYILAQRAAEGVLHISDLLTYSAVCGTGLDTIPLPGDVSEDALSSIQFDMAALALRLDKPLTARLMPIPGKKQGEETTFTFEYFANSRVVGVDEVEISAPLNGDERVLIKPRSSRRR